MLSSERKHILAPTRSCRGCTSNVISLQSTSLIRGKTPNIPVCNLPGKLQSTSLIRGKTMLKGYNPGGVELQSTSLIRGKTICWTRKHTTKLHFNPLPSSEGRRYSPQSPSHGSHFNPLPSSEGRLRYPHSKNESFILQSTSLIRGKTDQIFRIGVGLFTSIHFPHPREDSSMLQGVYGFETSIHFPHPREDSGQKRNLLVQRHFNPLPSSEGRRHLTVTPIRLSTLQSTSLIRGKTTPG